VICNESPKEALTAMTENNLKKKGFLSEKIERAFRRSLKRGFYGKVIFEISIHDGAIQDIDEIVRRKYK